MQRAIQFVNVSTVLGAIGLLLLSVWPGFLIGCFLVLALPLVVLLGVVWLGGAAVWFFGRRTAVSPPQLMVAPVLVILMLGLLTYYIPRRIVFLALHGLFERHLTTAQVSDYGGPYLGCVGIYRVDAYAADARGGVYFRTTKTADGIGPDTMSYGFAHRPNRQGTPFGASGYRVYRLHGDWCWFHASDDSY
jgi:hypothetical protein